MTIRTHTYVHPLKVYIVMSDENYEDEIDQIFLNRESAEEYAKQHEFLWVEEHEVVS